MATMVECKRCGETCVSWVQSTKTGRWYLAEGEVVRQGANGSNAGGARTTVVHQHRPHRCVGGYVRGRRMGFAPAEHGHYDRET